jgi:hypothetical protein
MLLNTERILATRFLLRSGIVSADYSRKVQQFVCTDMRLLQMLSAERRESKYNESRAGGRYGGETES